MVERSGMWKNHVFAHFNNLGSNMSLKVHFLHSHLDYFSKCNLGSVSEEQDKKFQNIKEMKRRY